MKKLGLLVLVVVAMSSCNGGTNVTIKVDSLGNKLDTIAKKAWDSTKKGVKNLEDKLDEKFEKKDSSGRKN
jgi:hypothetical protein